MRDYRGDFGDYIIFTREGDQAPSSLPNLLLTIEVVKEEDWKRRESELKQAEENYQVLARRNGRVYTVVHPDVEPGAKDDPGMKKILLTEKEVKRYFRILPVQDEI